MKKNIFLFLFLFICLQTMIIQEYQKSQMQHTINQYKIVLSLARMDSVIIDCVRCNQRNVKYLIDTTNGNTCKRRDHQ